jgi:hypothetical protein
MSKIGRIEEKTLRRSFLFCAGSPYNQRTMERGIVGHLGRWAGMQNQ